MRPSVYCYLSEGEVRFDPINTIDETVFPNEDTENEEREANELQKPIPKEIMNIRNKNILYKLNNASFSDLDADSYNECSNTPTSIQGDSSPNTSPSPPPTKDVNSTNVLNSYATHAIYLPECYIDLEENVTHEYREVKDLLLKVFERTWTDKTKITILKVTGGITNMLLSCTYSANNETVLMRVYGNGTNLIIDRHREFVLHLVLNSLSLAPPVHARFRNGLIYGFLPGRSLEPEELLSEQMYPMIAQQLGNWHSKVNSEVIQNGLENLRNLTFEMNQRAKDHGKGGDKKRKRKFKKRFISDVWELIEDWINIVPITKDLLDSFNENTSVDVTEDNLRDIVHAEFAWLKAATLPSCSPMVSSHCDLLSGNVIIHDDLPKNGMPIKLPPLSKNPVKFIDYEYMLPAPRAFDIANHLAEWQGFDCNKAAIPEASPSNPTMVQWVKGYLNNEDASEKEIDSLIKEISSFYGMPGFYWGIWAMIQSNISDIDFDYAIYGKSRLQEYWDWKFNYSKKT